MSWRRVRVWEPWGSAEAGDAEMGLQLLGGISPSVSRGWWSTASLWGPRHPQCGSVHRGYMTSFPQHAGRNNNKARQVIWYKGLSKMNCSSLKKKRKKKRESRYLPTASLCQASWGITTKRNPSVKPWWLRRKIFTDANSTTATFVEI